MNRYENNYRNPERNRTSKWQDANEAGQRSDSSTHRLVALEELDNWKVASDDEDIRGWELSTARGEIVGTVTSLIADPAERLVRYVEVEINDDLDRYRDPDFSKSLPEEVYTYYGENNDRFLLIPIGMVELDQENHRVVGAKSLSRQYIADSPRFRGINYGTIRPGYEMIVARHYADLDDESRAYYHDEERFPLNDYASIPVIRDVEFYRMNIFNQQNYIRSRREHSTSMVGFKTGMRY